MWSMAQWRWWPAWARPTAGFLRQGSRDNCSYKAHLSHSIRYCPPMLLLVKLLSPLPLQPPHTSGKKPDSRLYIYYTRHTNLSYWFRMPRIAVLLQPEAGGQLMQISPKTQLAVCFSCITFTKWLTGYSKSRRILWLLLCPCLCLRAHSSAQMQTQTGWGFTEKPVFIASAGLSPCRYKK